MKLTDSPDNDVDLALFIEAARAVFQHRKFILGPEVEMLEWEMTRWLHAGNAVGCNSGFGAPLFGLLAFDFELGAQIAVPVLAPSDVIGILLRKRFKPVLVDINPYDFQMDVSDLSHRIRESGKISTIIVHHLFGGAVDMKAVMQEATDKIPVIEVLTYSLGAHIDESYAGTFGTIATADLRTTIGSGAAGDAGMIWTNNSSLAEKMRKIRSENTPVEVHTGVVSGNFHQDTVQAAFLLHKFAGWKQRAKKRAEQIVVFAQTMRDHRVREITIPEFYNSYGTELVILAERRNELMAYLQKHDIETSPWCPTPIHLQPGFESLGYKRGDFPQAEWVTERLIQLPVPENAEEIEHLAKSIANFYGR